MSAINSDLSNSRYGYDAVVALTQASIDGTMKEFMSNLDTKEVIQCYIMDDNGNPQSIDYKELLQKTDGIDPFLLPESNVGDDQLKKLAAASFYYGFKAAIGLPDGYAPLDPSGPALPNIVTLNANSNQVSYNLMCSDFTVVEAKYGPKGIIGWLNNSQPSGKAWFFNANIPLSQLNVGANDASPSVQNAVSGLAPDTFSVQKLMLELDKAIVNTVPDIFGVVAGSPLDTALRSVFTGAYFAQLQQNGDPVLNYHITYKNVPPSSITLTGVELEVNPYIDNGSPVNTPDSNQAKAQSLCYLCEANNNPMKTPTEFLFNWVEMNDVNTYAGVMAINRNTFADFIKSLLDQTLTGINLDYGKILDIDVKTKLAVPYAVEFKYGMEGVNNGKVYSLVNDPSDPTHVLTYSWSTSDTSKSHDIGIEVGKFKCDYTANSDVYFEGNSIKIVTHLVVHGDIEILKIGKASGNWGDFTKTTNFIMSVVNNKIQVKSDDSPPSDNSQSVDDNIFSKIITMGELKKQVLDKIKDNIQNSLTSSLDHQAAEVQNVMNGPQSWIFPGGDTFSFQDVSFSDNQDLVSNLLYQTPV